jgi:hypothetical protein
MVRCFRVMEKKLTNSGPFMKSTGKHSIYTQDLDHAFDIRHHTRFSGAIIDRALRDKDH